MKSLTDIQHTMRYRIVTSINNMLISKNISGKRNHYLTTIYFDYKKSCYLFCFILIFVTFCNLMALFFWGLMVILKY